MHDVRLYSVLDTVVISGNDVCCSVVFSTLVGVFVFSVMWSELLMTSAISCPEVIFPHITRRTLAQLRTNRSPFLKSYLHKVDAISHPSPLCPLCNTHIRNTHHLFNCTYMRTTWSPLDLWTEKLAGGPQAGRSDSPTSHD